MNIVSHILLLFGNSIQSMQETLTNHWEISTIVQFQEFCFAVGKSMILENIILVLQ